MGTILITLIDIMVSQEKMTFQLENDNDYNVKSSKFKLGIVEGILIYGWGG